MKKQNKWIKEAKKCLKGRKVKELFKDVDYHFKIDKWPLDYAYYLSELDSHERFYFVAILKVKGYKVVTKNYRLMIVRD